MARDKAGHLGKGRRTRMLSVRCTEAEYLMVRKLAETHRQSVSEYVMTVLTRELPKLAVLSEEAIRDPSRRQRAMATIAEETLAAMIRSGVLR